MDVEEASFPTELVIPVNRWKLFGSSGINPTPAGGVALSSVGFLVVGVSAATWLAREGLDSINDILSALAAVAILVACGYFLRDNLRKLSRGLVLNTSGFEYDGCQWRWSEIRRIAAVKNYDGDGGYNMIIALTMRDGYAKRGNPIWTEIDVANFRTGDEPLERIMRRWLKRYGTPTPIDTEPADESEGSGQSDGR